MQEAPLPQRAQRVRRA